MLLDIFMANGASVNEGLQTAQDNQEAEKFSCKFTPNVSISKEQLCDSKDDCEYGEDEEPVLCGININIL